MHSRLALFVAPLVLTATQTFADAVVYTPDRWHTRIYFNISHMGLSDYQGRFIDYEFKFKFDEEDFSNSSVEVSVPIAGIDTFSPELTEKMPRDEFFASDRYPEARFISTSIEPVDSTTATMTGDLTIKGVTRSVTFDVRYNGKVLHPYYNLNNVGFTATGEIDSRDFGVNTLPEWMLGSAVQLRVEMEAFEGEKVPYYSD